jgi:hypothetical protein
MTMDVVKEGDKVQLTCEAKLEDAKKNSVKS